MTRATPTRSIESDQAYEDDLTEMMEEIGAAVAAGLVPVVGQAINVYDTVECLLALYNSKGAEAQNEAKFDLVLALVGWIPGAGGGVKKTIRIVNKNPDRYAPILFDVLRMVCLKLGIYTSPELLLEKLFDAGKLSSVLTIAQTSVETSWVYERMPQAGQHTLSITMAAVRDSLPAMVMLVTTKLTRWKRLQRNTSARSAGGTKKDASAIKPAAKDHQIAKQGANTPNNVSSNAAGNSTVGAAIIEVTNEAIGMLGEHITDYFLYEEYGWGRDWTSHDQGVDGSWKNKPGRLFPGKLNEGTKLNPLKALKAHGVGLDGVWKVALGDPHNNGKPYAIVESKASAQKRNPKKISRKPSIGTKLSSNERRINKALASAAAAAAVLPGVENLLEPDSSETAIMPGKASRLPGGKPSGGSVTSKRSNPKSKKKHVAGPASNKSETAIGKNEMLVQMSWAWIRKNIFYAVKDKAIIRDIRSNYKYVASRHLFYTPFYLPTAATHLAALQSEESSAGALNASHKNHSIPSTHRYGEAEVKRAVNAKLSKLELDLEP